MFWYEVAETCSAQLSAIRKIPLPNNPYSLLELTTDLVRAYLQNNNLPAAALPDVIRATYGSLSALGAPPAAAPGAQAPGAVTVRKSLASPDHIISMIDGRPYRTLKKHIGHHGMTPQSYREMFNLPDSYPMVAPSYSAQRRAISIKLGLGRKPATASAPAPAPAPAAIRRKLKISGPKAD